MSLLHRVVSTDQREVSSPHRRESTSGFSRRRLSFNPVGKWAPPEVLEEPIETFEINKKTRLVQVTVAVFYCLLSAGTIFGYAALKPVLVDEGAYRNFCSKDERDRGVPVCFQQEIRLNFMFAIAAVATNMNALPAGAILDRFGPRISSLIGCFFLTLGSLFMAFASQLSFDAYVPGYLFLALGGPFVFISSFQLSNAFPRYSGLVLALLTGAFDTSSAVFLGFRLFYQASEGNFTSQKFFLSYLVVPAIILIAQVTIMPTQPYKTVGELMAEVEDPMNDAHESDAGLPQNARADVQAQRRARRESVISEIHSFLGDESNTLDDNDDRRPLIQLKKHQADEERKQRVSGVWGALHGQTARSQIFTLWFTLITLFTTVQMLRINFFVATIRPQYEYLMNSPETAERINSIFDVALPAGGIFAIPIVGFILDNTSTTFVLSLLVGLATIIGGLGLIPQAYWAAYLHIGLFVLYRPFFYTSVSDYAAKVFGFATFGKVYGLMICLAGLGSLVQTGLDTVMEGRLKGDPTLVNTALLIVAVVLGTALVVYVAWRARTMKRDLLEDEAEGAREVLMPGADPSEAAGQGRSGHSGIQTYGTTESSS